jgi:outer membrane lipopolysaccharide assembly protein LptE/RlpB
MFAVSAPIATPQAAVVLRVTGREQPNASGLSQEEPAIRDALREPLAQQLVQQRLEALQKAVKIEYNAALLERAG